MSLGLALLGALSMTAASAKAPDLARLLPAQADGWQGDGADEVADRDGLFQLLDGGAEAYRALNVQTVLERRYAKPSAPDIIVDLFDMGSSADAYGAYHRSMREGQPAGVGQESELQGGNLAFWKGRYFASVVPLRPSPAAQGAVVAIGKAISANIPQTGDPPALTRMLPAAGLVPSQVHYFHDWPLLRAIGFFSGENALGLDRDTEGLLARYRLPGADAGGEGSALLLVRYPSAERARAAREELEKDPARLDPRHRLAPRQMGDVLAVALDAPSAAAAQKLLGSIRRP